MERNECEEEEGESRAVKEEVWRCEEVSECLGSLGTTSGHLVTCALSPQVGVPQLGGCKPPGL